MRVEIDCAEIKAPGIYVSRIAPRDFVEEPLPYDDGLGVFRGLIFGMAIQTLVFLGIYLVYRVL